MEMLLKQMLKQQGFDEEEVNKLTAVAGDQQVEQG